MRALFQSLIVLPFILSPKAIASSPEAWDAFRARVLNACEKMAPLPRPRVEVDPFGTPKYGLALLHYQEPSRRYICVYEKRSGRVEIGGRCESD